MEGHLDSWNRCARLVKVPDMICCLREVEMAEGCEDGGRRVGGTLDNQGGVAGGRWGDGRRSSWADGRGRCRNRKNRWVFGKVRGGRGNGIEKENVQKGLR